METFGEKKTLHWAKTFFYHASLKCFLLFFFFLDSEQRLKMSVLWVEGTSWGGNKRVREALTIGDSSESTRPPCHHRRWQPGGSAAAAALLISSRTTSMRQHGSPSLPPSSLHALIETNIPEIRFMSFHNERVRMIIVGEAAGDARTPDLVFIKRWLLTSFFPFSII